MLLQVASARDPDQSRPKCSRLYRLTPRGRGDDAGPDSGAREPAVRAVDTPDAPEVVWDTPSTDPAGAAAASDPLARPARAVPDEATPDEAAGDGAELRFAARLFVLCR